MFSKIKTAFFGMKLSRVQFVSAFGKIVIPESNLIEGLESAAGENLFCILPVGKIGTNVIAINYDDNLIALRNVLWNENEYFYDITEVIYSE